MEPPKVVYHRLLLENRTQLALEQKQDTWLGYGKMAVFFAGAAAAVSLLHFRYLPGVLLLLIFVFLLLLLAHERVIQSLQERKRVIEFYERGIARLENRWAGTGNTGDRFLDLAHPYARDLDLFGEGSLFELLCTVRTRAGEQTLARWLLCAASPEEVYARQSAIMEMKDRLRFRERLFVTGESARLGVRPEALTAWGIRKGMFSFRWLAQVLAILAILWFASAAYSLTIRSWLPFLAMSLVNSMVSFTLRKNVDEAASVAEDAGKEVKVLAKVLKVIEEEAFESPRLHALRESLRTAQIAPSVAVRKLDRIVGWLEHRRNLIVIASAPFTFYTIEVAIAAERWQQTFGPTIDGWLSAVGEIEALSALAGYASEHSADVLPEFVEERACFEAEGLAHPLLPEGIAVGNDLTLGADMRLIVISGPNMAGKSTFLRGVGLNAVLAQCGAPVRATRLRLSPLSVGASICVLDSVQGGVSRFYAEIKRLKLLSDLAQGPVALLFLLDELLSGTNSQDRLDGTRFLLRALVRQGAIGMVTTHDLALTGIPDTMDEPAQNGHFEDGFKDGTLTFDYRLHPGIVRTSNALKLMQAVGLELE